MSEKPPFDPTQPFETTAAIKPEFDPSQPFESAPKADPITLNKIVRSAATGVPILGGLMNKANAATNAALAPIIEPFLTKGPDTLDQPTFGERYAKSLELQDKQDEKFSAEHPVVDTAAQLAGGVGATLPLAAGTLGPMAARAMGMGGTNLIGQTLRSVASGAGINAADALVRGNDVGTSAGIGAAVGAAAPAAGRLVGAAISPVATTIRGIVNPAEEAARRVGVAVRRGQEVAQTTPGNPRNPLTPQEAAAAETAGFPTNVMDTAGEPGRALARSAVNTSPEGGHILNRAVDDRFDSQSMRMAQWLRSRFNFPDAHAQQQAIEQGARTANRTAYQQAYQDSRGVTLWNPGLEGIAQAPVVQDAIRIATPQLRNWAVRDGFRPPVGAFQIDGLRTTLRQTNSGNTYLPSLQYWDYIKRALDQMNTPVSRTFAHSLRTELDNLVPSYQAARRGAAQAFNAENVLEAGQNFAMPAARFDNQVARDALQRMSPQERQLFEDGFIDRHAQQLSEMGTRRNAAGAIANSDAAIERMHIALGPQRAGQVEAMVRLERLMDLARPAVQGNSSTARQLAQLGLAGGTGAITSGGNPFDPQALITAGLTYGALRGRSAINERVSRQVAELLASNNHARVAQGMRIAGQQRFLDALRRTDAALSKVGSVQAEPHPSGP